MLLVSYAGLIVQFWRDNFWNWDDIAWMGAIVRVLRNEEEGVPEVGRFNAGQKFVFWSMALLVPALFLTGLVIWEVYFGEATTHRDPEGRGAHSQLRGDCGDHHLDHPCLRGDLGARLDARDDARLCDARLGVASSSQMAARASWRQARAALVRGARPSGLMRQGETAPKGGWIGNATGGVKAPEPDPASRPRSPLRSHGGAARAFIEGPPDGRMARLHGEACTRPASCRDDARAFDRA